MIVRVRIAVAFVCAFPMIRFSPSKADHGYDNLEVKGGNTVTATFTVTNTGERAGADVPSCT